ncbi:MAG TPA: 4Fe-4S binding protein, partial [Sedimentisphaerales bacterium]|nr:4Fe-4S binding protein [Sedimentisphaerales bacterium]
MKELVVISGKGGTGKTSITAAFAALAQGAVLADCDVDAADLHIVLSPSVKQTSDFSGGRQAAIDPAKCIGCGRCAAICRF